MGRTRVLNGNIVPFTPEEEVLADAEQETVESMLLKQWAIKMKESDKTLLPRWLEDHIEKDHGGTTTSSDLQARYDAKKALRGKRP